MAENKFEKQRQKDKAKFEKERAQWQKKDAKARSKKTRKIDVTRIVFTAIAVVVVGALVIGLGGNFLLSYGVPARWMPVITVAGTTIRQPEYTVLLNHEFLQRNHVHAMQFAQWEVQFGFPVGDHQGLNPWASPFGQPMLNPATQVPVLDDNGAPLLDANGQPRFESIREPITDDDGNPMYWEDHLIEHTNRFLQNQIIQYNEARRLGLELSAAQQAEIDADLNELRERAIIGFGGGPMSVNTFLRLNNVPGYTERTLRRVMEREALVEVFADYQEAVLAESFSEEDVRAFYQEDSSRFDFVDVRIMPFVAAQTTRETDESNEDFAARQEQAVEDAHQRAADFVAGVADEASFLAAAQAILDAEAANEGDDIEALDAAESTDFLRHRRHHFDQNFSVDRGGEEPDQLADWLFDNARNNDDTTIFEGNDNRFYAVLLLHTAYAINAVDFYTLRLPVTSGAPVPPENEAELEDWDMHAASLALQQQATDEALQQANDLLARFAEDGGDSDAFRALGNVEILTGALPGSPDLIAETNQWLFEHARLVGDTAIFPVTNQAGTVTEVIIIFLANVDEDTPNWLVEGRQLLTFDAFDDFILGLHDNYPVRQHNLGMRFVRWAVTPLMDWHIAMRRHEFESEMAAGANQPMF